MSSKLNKNNFRKKYKKIMKYIKFSPILKETKVPKTNFSQFLSGNDSSLSIEKLIKIDKRINEVIKEILDTNKS